MNFLRRVYLLLVSLLLVIVVTALLLSPQTVIEWVGQVSELAVALRVALAVIFGLLLLALMYVQIRPDPKPQTGGLMMRASGALTEVSVESARDRILKAVNDVPDVVSAEVDVKPIRGKADIELQVEVLGHDVKLPAKQKEISRALRQVIDKQLGLRMAGQPRIHIRFHKEEPVVKPPMTVVPPTVVVPPVVEEVPPVQPVKPPPPAAPEPEPEPEPEGKAGGLFGWLGSKEDDREDATLRLPEKPAAEPPEAVSKKTDTAPLLDEDEPEIAPPLSSLMNDVQSLEIKPQPPPASESEVDKSVVLDLDDELAHSATDDFEDEDEPEPGEAAVEGEKTDTEDENRSSFA